MSTPSCSVVVPTLRRVQTLERCLEALVRLDHPDFEIVVVDNSGGDPEVRRLATHVGAQVVIEPREGLSVARNAGARAARGEVLAFTDDDAFPRPDWLRLHGEALERDRTLTATTGRILPWPPDAPAGAAYLAAGGEDMGEQPFRIDRTTPRWFERTNFGGLGVGPNMAFRRAPFDAGWGFRESLGPVRGLPGEEHYALYTLVRDGHAVAYLPDAVVDHSAPASRDALRERKRRILRGSAAYALMLLAEEREHRRDVLGYLWGAVSGRRRNWRQAPSEAPFATRGDRLAAGLLAPASYALWRMRFRGERRPRRVWGPIEAAET